MVRIFIGKPLENVTHIHHLIPFLGPRKRRGLLFNDPIDEYYKEPFFKLADKIEEADFLMLPHGYFTIKDKYSDYVNNYISLSKEYKKPLILFTPADVDDIIEAPNSIVFRTSQYGYKKRPNEIIIPPHVEDLSKVVGLNFRRKSGKPVVGFCGWAEYSDWRVRIKSAIKHLAIDLKKILYLNPGLEVHKKGIYFRKKAIKYLENSDLVKTNFIIRKSYSAHEKTVSVDPKIARNEFINNLVNSDFGLVVKGDGNFANRFYEIISLGRIPFLIDTDCVLPLPDLVNYEEFMLKISYRDIKQSARALSDFYSKISEEEFLAMQKKARETFEKYLRIDSFYKFIFADAQRLKKYAGY